MKRAGVKMDTIAMTIWIAAIAILVFSLLWFLFGTTAFFQRGVDLETTFLYIIFWTPVLIITLAVVSVLVLKFDWVTSATTIVSGQRLLALFIMLIAIGSASASIHLTPTEGWLTERVQSDIMQTTPDGKYEYRVEVINKFQKNAYMRVYVKNVTTHSDARIRLDVQPKETIITSAGSYPREAWFAMYRASEDNVYILSTTKFYYTTYAAFEIDMRTNTSNRIE